MRCLNELGNNIILPSLGLIWYVEEFNSLYFSTLDLMVLVLLPGNKLFKLCGFRNLIQCELGGVSM